MSGKSKPVRRSCIHSIQNVIFLNTSLQKILGVGVGVGVGVPLCIGALVLCFFFRREAGRRNPPGQMGPVPPYYNVDPQIAGRVGNGGRATRSKSQVNDDKVWFEVDGDIHAFFAAFFGEWRIWEGKFKCA